MRPIKATNFRSPQSGEQGEKNQRKAARGFGMRVLYASRNAAPAAIADELGVPLLGQLPLVPQLREGGDDGRPIAAVAPDSEAGRIFHQMASRVAKDMKPKKIFSKFLKVN